MYNDKKFRLKIKSFRQLYLIFLIISFLLAVIIFYILDFSFYPYQLKILKKQPQKSNYFNLYHDFDKDGFSELISACSSKEEKEHSFFHFINYSGGIVDQFNFTEPISIQKIFMNDYNGDGYDEIFVFTGEEDSLFLSVIDAYRKKYILKRHFLLKNQKPFSHSKNKWHIYSAVFLDANDNNGKEIIFIAISGNSYQPRGIYSFNIEKQKITKKFETAAYVQHILPFDLTGDGNKEIILTSGAVGNIHYPAPYKDDRCWLFVLDRSFKPVFKPRPFGEYSSRLCAYPVDNGKEKHLILVYNYFGNKNLSNFFYLINSKGEIVKSKPFHRHNSYGRTGLLADQFSGSPGWFANISGNKLIRINDQLEPVLTESINYKNFWILCFKDLDADGQPELLCCNDENILIYNNQLKLAALHKIEKLITQFNQFSLKYNGAGKPIHICMDTQEYSYLIAFQKSLVYSYLPVIYILLTGLIFLILMGCHISASRIYIYFSFFLHSLHKSSNGIMILNHKGNIIYLNSRVQPLLNLSNQIFKKQHFTKALQEKQKIIEIIQKGITIAKPIKEDISIVKANHQFEGEISITPFISSIGIVYAYMVEMHDYTQPILSDRLQLWSKGAQKIAHDIKQPLSSVALNLKALQMRVEEIPVNNKEDLMDDIEMMHKELNRIRNLTKGFLKFANMEKPHFQVVNLSEIIEKSIAQYKTYTDGNIKIQIEIASDVKEIWVDPQQIEIVFHILIENAIDAMKGKGLIYIDVYMAQYLEEFNHRFVEIEVSDAGPGFDPEIRDKIFEPYFTTKKEGTGMGLAIAKKIIEDHGGKIDLYTKENLGAVIRFSVPVYEDKD